MNCTLLDALYRAGNSTSAPGASPMMALTVGEVDYYIQHYIFPVQFCLGVLGNSINLVVLLSSGMKNQANILLSAMAFADLAFLFCMLPHSLVSFSIFYKSIRFAYFYFLSKIHCVALANCFSTAATFLVLAVSLERFSGVRSPMHTRFQLRQQRLLHLILAIYALAFGLSLFHHLEYKVTIRVDCDRVLAKFQHVTDLNTSSFLVGYVRTAKYVQSFIGVFLPVIAVAVLNVSLVYFLRKRQLLPRTVNGSGNGKCALSIQQQEFRYSDIGTFQRRERKVTATVIAIVSCFTVTHLPTLVPVVWEHFLERHSHALVTVSAILNCILVTGKVLNFFLFCSSSVHFRRRAILILNAHLCQGRMRKKKYSSMALSNLATQTNLTSIGSNTFQSGAVFTRQHSREARPLSLQANGHATAIGGNNNNSHHGTNGILNEGKGSTGGGLPAYRLPKQSTLSLREALLRQSGAEFDDPPTEEEQMAAIKATLSART